MLLCKVFSWLAHAGCYVVFFFLLWVFFVCVAIRVNIACTIKIAGAKQSDCCWKHLNKNAAVIWRTAPDLAWMVDCGTATECTTGFSDIIRQSDKYATTWQKDGKRAAETFRRHMVQTHHSETWKPWGAFVHWSQKREVATVRVTVFVDHCPQVVILYSCTQEIMQGNSFFVCKAADGEPVACLAPKQAGDDV